MKTNRHTFNIPNNIWAFQNLTSSEWIEKEKMKSNSVWLLSRCASSVSLGSTPTLASHSIITLCSHYAIRCPSRTLVWVCAFFSFSFFLLLFFSFFLILYIVRRILFSPVIFYFVFFRWSARCSVWIFSIRWTRFTALSCHYSALCCQLHSF